MATTDRREACARCRWWDGLAFSDRGGECRRFAPRRTIGEIDPDARYANPETAGWPMTKKDDFCGEFEAS